MINYLRTLVADLRVDVPSWIDDPQRRDAHLEIYRAHAWQEFLSWAADVAFVVSTGFDQLPKQLILSAPVHEVNMALFRLHKWISAAWNTANLRWLELCAQQQALS